MVDVKKIKKFLPTLLFAVCVMVLVVSVTSTSQQNISGKAFYKPVQIYGTVYPNLPNGTKIEFKINDLIEVASTTLINNQYGYEPKVFFDMDDSLTEKIEGYSKGDVVGVYIEGIKISEFSYFEAWETQKIINIPVSKREEISKKAAESSIGCVPIWDCEEWSKCIKGLQSRNCIDVTNCGNERGKPETSMRCNLKPELGLTQRVRLISEETIFLAMFVLILIGFMISISRRAKEYSKKNHSKKK